MFPRRLMGGGGESRVATSAAAAVGDDNALVRLREVVDFVASLIIKEDGTDRDFQGDVFSFASGLIGAFAVTSALSFVFTIEAEMNEGVVALARFHQHIAAAAAVSARRTTAGNKFFPTKSHAAVAAVSRLHPNFGLVNKHEQKKRPGKSRSPFNTEVRRRGPTSLHLSFFFGYPVFLLRFYRLN